MSGNIQKRKYRWPVNIWKGVNHIKHIIRKLSFTLNEYKFKNQAVSKAVKDMRQWYIYLLVQPLWELV